jgi:DNA replication protein DnaC
VFDYLTSLEWVRAQSNLMIIGPTGTGKSHTLIGLGVAAVHAGHKVRYFTATDLVETLYRGLADTPPSSACRAVPPPSSSPTVSPTG